MLQRFFVTCTVNAVFSDAVQSYDNISDRRVISFPTGAGSCFVRRDPLPMVPRRKGSKCRGLSDTRRSHPSAPISSAKSQIRTRAKQGVKEDENLLRGVGKPRQPANEPVSYYAVCGRDSFR